MFGIAMALLLLAGGADAGELLTPPLFVDQLLACIVTNVSSTARTCRIEVLNGMGNPVVVTTEATLAAGASTSVSLNAVSDILRSRLTGEGHKSNFQATGVVRFADGSDDHVVAQ